MGSLNRIMADPNLTPSEKYQAAELYDRADFALRRYGMSAIINF